MEQDMYMVVRPIDCDRLNSLVVADAGHIGPQFRLHVLGDESLSLFCAENQMNVDAGKRMRHAFLRTTAIV